MGARAQALRAFVRLGRPQFLVGGALLYGLGAAAALALLPGTRFAFGAFAMGQGAITLIQLMTHYANDYFDLEADNANATPTRWSGGSRVLPGGVVSPIWALRAARLLATLGLLVAGFIAWRGFALASGAGAPGSVGGGLVAAAVVLVLAQMLAWCYSAPPVALHSRGLGELTTAIVVTGLTPLCGFLLQAPDLAVAARALPLLGAALWPLLGLQFAMLLAIEFPDAAGDAVAGKRTLVVRLGAARAAALYQVVLVASYGALPLFASAGVLPAVMLGAAIPIPLAAWQFRRLAEGRSTEPAAWEGLAFRGVALLVVTAATELGAMLWTLSGTK